jgi:hypothetical protein
MPSGSLGAELKTYADGRHVLGRQIGCFLPSAKESPGEAARASLWHAGRLLASRLAVLVWRQEKAAGEAEQAAFISNGELLMHSLNIDFI